MSNETNLNAAQTNHIIFGKGGKMNKRISFVLAAALVVNLFGMVAPARAQLMITVPDVVGMTEAAAESALDSASCVYVYIISYEYSDTVPYAQVISQDPTGGTSVGWDSRVYLVIGGPQMVDVPDVVGMSESAAESAIINAGLDGHVWHEVSDTVSHGYVISQDPAGGTTVCIGASVRLRICEKYQVPNVVGMTEAAARSAITSCGFPEYIVHWYEYSDTVPEGHVIRQSPLGGKSVSIGVVQHLAISKGPVPMVEVPDVVGMSGNAAGQAIRNAGLIARSGRYGQPSDTVPSAHVISQDPAGGTSVCIGAEVHLVICERYKVLNVVGMTEADARLWINCIGPRTYVGDISYEYFDTVPYAQVVSQDPKAGTWVGRYSRVDLVIGSSQRADVPDVVGMSESAADQAIINAGLIAGRVVRGSRVTFSDTVSHGYVISQEPAGGTTVCIGAPVRLVICEKYKVPDVVGMTEAAAEGAFFSRNLFAFNISRSYSDTIPAGCVIRQWPKGGTWVGRNYGVGVNISRGPWMVGVPAVVGMRESDARSAINSAELSVGTIGYLYSDTVPYAQVISQDPPGGTSVGGGSVVDLVIGGPWMVDVPDLVGMSNHDAYHAIRNAGLVGRYSDAVGSGHVISQEPAGGTSVCIGAWVRYGIFEKYQVPNVVGMTEAAAESALDSCRLKDSKRREHSDTVPEGLVISQDPEAGTWVGYPYFVRVFISRGPCPFVVPDVVGMSYEDACLAMKSAGYKAIWGGGEYSATVPQEYVISQDPAGGTRLDRGSYVRLIKSLGPGTAPDVVGMSKSDACSAIRSAGYNDFCQHAYSDTVEEGYVISQDPAGGTRLDRYSVVSFIESIGPDPGGPYIWTVPWVVGMSESDARSAIHSAGYGVHYRHGYSDTVEEGYVISQDPAGGTRVGKGSCVKIIISRGPWTTVPAVVGMSESDAASAINFAGLSVGTIVYLYSDTVPEGCVISQDPEAGKWVAGRYSTVDLVISRGPLRVGVPDVVGMSESDAASAINSAELSVGTIGYLYSDTVPAGCVISLYPRAGTVLDAGTEVDLDISLGPAPRYVPPIPVPPDASCLLAHWKLDEIEGAIAYDSSVNGNHGMVYGNSIWQPTGGIIEGTLEFDGDGDYVEIPKIGESVEFTYAMWVAQNQVGSGLIALIDHKDWVYGSVQFELRDGHPKVGINGAITPADDLDAWGHTLAAGEWHHVALAKSATELLMYVDGEEAARSELTMSDTVILGDGCIGAWVNPTWGKTRYFDGWVDDVRIYDCALDENQIKCLISALPSPVLSEALDTALSSTTGGSADWFSQTTTIYYDGDAAQSGDIRSYQDSWMQTTVSGTGTVSFYWKVSSERYCDFLEFYIDGSLQEKISGSVDWQQMMYTISTSGSHVLEWRYVKDYIVKSGSDCGWVDKVEWIITP